MVEPAITAAGDRSVAAQEIRDSIIVTGDNVRIKVSAGGLGGTLLDLIGIRPRSHKRARQKPLDVRDEPFADRIDRESEVQAFADLSGSPPLTVSGEALVGKTYVLRAAVAEPSEPGRDGIVCLYGRGKTLEDLLQSLWEAVYETKPPTRPGDGELVRDLAELEALVVVDAAELDHSDGQRLAAITPKSRLVLVTRERQLWDGSELVVAGLPPAEALALLERGLGRALSPDERPLAAEVCAALKGHPQRLRQAATAIKRSMDSLTGKATWPADLSAAPAVLEAAIASLDQQELGVLAVLAQFRGVPLSRELLEELAGTGAGKAAAGLVEAGLATSNSPSFAAAGEVDDVLPATTREDAYGRAVEHLVEAGETGALRGNDLWAALSLIRNAARLERPQDVVRLGLALTPALVLARRFGAWREAVGLVRRGAGQLNDRGAEGWALHEAGTRALCLGDVAAGRGLLRRGLKVREEAGDVVGCAATRHNLRLPGRPPWYLRRIAHLPVLVLIGLLGMLGFSGGGGAVVWMVTHHNERAIPPLESVAVEITPRGSGRVRSLEGDIKCPMTCTTKRALGGSIRLRPSPAVGFEFAGWSEPCGTELVCELAVQAPTTITARFRRTARKHHSLRLTFAGGGRGSVASDSITCSSTCERNYKAGRIVHLVAHPEVGSRFVGWSQLCGKDARCRVALTTDLSLTVTFSIAPVATVQLKVVAEGPGTVISRPAGISCGEDCEGTFTKGKDVVLTAEPDIDAVFDGWGPGCAATGTTCALTGVKPLTIRADFSTRTGTTTPTDTSTLTVKRQGSGEGSITVDTADAGPRPCSFPCKVQVDRGTSVSVHATPAPGSKFGGWSKTSCGTGSSCAVQIDRPTTLDVTFIRRVTLTVEAVGRGNGTVQIDGTKCTTPTCMVTVDKGTTAGLTATAAPDSAFAGWSLVRCGSSTSCSVVMSSDRTVQARFEPLDTLTIHILGRRPAVVTSPSMTISCVQVTCTGQAMRGTKVRLDPKPPRGLLFSGWKRTPGCESSVVPGKLPPCTVVLKGPTTVYAAFALAIPLTVTVQGGNLGSLVLDLLGATCVSRCNYQVPQGMSLAVTAKPGPNVLAWGDACARVRGYVCNLTISAPTLVSATFYTPPG